MSSRAVQLALQSSQRERAAEFEAGAALWEAFFGNASVARQTATDALRLSTGRDVEYGAAFALALTGDLQASESLAQKLAEPFPEDTSVQFSYLPALRALCALDRRDPGNALGALENAVPYDFAVPASSYYFFFGALYPVYVRGEAYLAAHRVTEAVTEFQKILAHRGMVLADPVGIMARFELGRALSMAGDKAKAKAAYQDFLTLWKDADPDVPILKEAKAEYARLF